MEVKECMTDRDSGDSVEAKTKAKSKKQKQKAKSKSKSKSKSKRQRQKEKHESGHIRSKIHWRLQSPFASV